MHRVGIPVLVSWNVRTLSLLPNVLPPIRTIWMLFGRQGKLTMLGKSNRRVGNRCVG